jgi:hypothetical protein
MKIEVVGATPVKIVQASPLPRQRLSGGGPSRVGSAPGAAGAGGQRRGGNRNGGGGRGGRGGNNSNPRQPKAVRTAADLDADLDAHNAKMQTE